MGAQPLPTAAGEELCDDVGLSATLWGEPKQMTSAVSHGTADTAFAQRVSYRSATTTPTSKRPALGHGAAEIHLPAGQCSSTSPVHVKARLQSASFRAKVDCGQALLRSVSMSPALTPTPPQPQARTASTTAAAHSHPTFSVSPVSLVATPAAQSATPATASPTTDGDPNAAGATSFSSGSASSFRSARPSSAYTRNLSITLPHSPNSTTNAPADPATSSPANSALQLWVSQAHSPASTSTPGGHDATGTASPGFARAFRTQHSASASTTTSAPAAATSSASTPVPPPWAAWQPRAASSRTSGAASRTSSRSTATAAAQFAPYAGPGAVGTSGWAGGEEGMARQCSLGGKDLHTPRRKGVVEVAEENAQLKNSLVALQQQLSLCQVAQRRSEAEAARLRGSLLRAESALAAMGGGTPRTSSSSNFGRGAGTAAAAAVAAGADPSLASLAASSPSQQASLPGPGPSPSPCLLSPSCSPHLVAGLRQQLAESEAERAELRRKLDAVAKSTKATAVSELQAEVRAVTQELRRGEVLGVRLAGRLEAAMGRIAELEGQLGREREANQQHEQLAEAAAAQALSLRCSWCGAQAAWAGRRVSSARGSGGDGGCCADADVDPLGGAGSGTGEPLALPPGNPLSSVRQPATCAAVQKAAELLSGLARMIDTFVPQGSTYRSSMSAMERWAKLRGPVVGGAPHVLRLLRAHEKRLSAAFGRLPGASKSVAPPYAQRPSAMLARPSGHMQSPGVGEQPCAGRSESFYEGACEDEGGDTGSCAEGQGQLGQGNGEGQEGEHEIMGGGDSGVEGAEEGAHGEVVNEEVVEEEVVEEEESGDADGGEGEW